jgi:hypothetical protein
MKLFTNIILLILCSSSFAKNISGQALTLYIENDTRDIGGPGSDNAYTNGLKFSYILAENDVQTGLIQLSTSLIFLKKQLKRTNQTLEFL